MLFACFINVFSFCLETGDYFAVVQAIKGGFLRALLDCSPAFPRIYDDIVQMALDIVRETLPLYMVYRSFVDAIVPFVRVCMSDPHYKELLAQPMVAEAFAPFFATFDRRLPVIQSEKDGGNGAASSRCHNVKCQNLNAPLKRCQACQQVYYCSVECQRLDWKATHRELCEPFGMERPFGIREKRDMASVRAIASYTADINHTFFRTVAERDFPDTPYDQLIPWIDFTGIPETLSLHRVADAVHWEPNLPAFMERCRSWNAIPVGCSRRNGARNENLWLHAGRRDFWTDDSPGKVEEDLGQLSFEGDVYDTK